MRRGSAVAGCDEEPGTEASGTPDSCELVVMRPFLAALPGGGGPPRRFVDMLEDRAVFLLGVFVDKMGQHLSRD